MKLRLIAMLFMLCIWSPVFAGLPNVHEVLQRKVSETFLSDEAKEILFQAAGAQNRREKMKMTIGDAVQIPFSKLQGEEKYVDEIEEYFNRARVRPLQWEDLSWRLRKALEEAEIRNPQSFFLLTKWDLEGMWGVGGKGRREVMKIFRDAKVTFYDNVLEFARRTGVPLSPEMSIARIPATEQEHEEWEKQGIQTLQQLSGLSETNAIAAKVKTAMQTPRSLSPLQTERIVSSGLVAGRADTLSRKLTYVDELAASTRIDFERMGYNSVTIELISEFLLKRGLYLYDDALARATVRNEALSADTPLARIRGFAWKDLKKMQAHDIVTVQDLMRSIKEWNEDAQHRPLWMEDVSSKSTQEILTLEAKLQSALSPALENSCTIFEE